ncbi:OapC/ArvC family zinc-ribbon domain-containing protein [Haladaptatus cibarius]|uniref:OapC/ArvC family zinc-ribbon domain-containing protein n=1 Tax=Haladaptatus cibarius TaxID=453847 RepID=UPI000678F096|nr:Zn-ribbon containing protein [Haladaptatus cibarius]
MPHKCTNCGRAFADGSKEMLSGCPDCGGNKFQFRPSGSSPDETTATGSANATAETKNEAPDTASSSGAVGRAASTVRGWVGSNDRTKNTQSGGSRNEQTTSSRDTQTNASRNQQKTSQNQQTESTASETPARERKQRTKSAKSAGEPTSASGAKPTDDRQKPTGNRNSTRTRTPADESQGDSPAPVQSEEDRAQASARAEIVPEDELPETPTQEGTGTVVEAPSDNQPSLDELREELNSQFESIKVVEPGQYELNLMELYERDEYIIALKENGRYVIQVPDSWAGSTDS